MSQTDTIVGGDWPLVGRSGEVRLLTDLLVRDNARGMVLAGPPGVGKTRLGLEWLQAAERAGFAVCRTTAIASGVDVPFASVAPLFGSSGPDAASLGGADLFTRFASALAARAGAARLALLVDDAHLLDDLSAMLIYQLVSSDASPTILVTVRSHEVAPDSVTALWKDGLLDRLELRGLDGEVVDELLVAALGDPVDRGTVARLAARCQGNVFFLRELVLGALHAGTLVREEGVWRLVGALTPSPRLIEVVRSRLADLNENELLLVEALSVAEPLGPAELAAVADFPEAERLERTGLLRSGLAGRRLEFRLAHPLHGEVLRASQSALRFRRLTRVLGDAVEGTGARREEDSLRLATWRLDAGEASASSLLGAAAIAQRRNSLALAERLARAALEVGGGFAAAVAVAQLAFLQGRGDEAEADLSALAARAQDDAERGVVASMRMENLRLLGRFAQSRAVAEQAAAELTDPAWRDELAAKLALVLLDVEGPEAAASAAEAIRPRARGRSLVWATLVSALALARSGRLEAALAAADHGRSTHIEQGGPRPDRLASAHALARAEAVGRAGRLGEAEAALSAEYAAAVAQSAIDTQAWAVWQLARVILAQGRLVAAARCAREACALFRHLHRPTLLRNGLVALATAEALQGNAGKADAILAEADGLGLPTSYWVEAERLSAAAWTAAARGDVSRAHELLQEAASVGERVGDRLAACSALHDRARLGEAREVLCRLRDLAGEVEGPLATTMAAHVTALAAKDGASLDAASLGFEDMGALLLAAEAAADAAVAWQRAGEVRAAAAASRRAGTIAGHCEGAATPALATIQSRVLLTPAERECAMMAIAGRSNREIADALYLSVRTVENRLQRIYEKLGISGRADLAAALES